MARNEEKSQSMLNRFLQLKQEERKKPRERRPWSANDCNSLPDAERWRSSILRDIGRKVTEIQNSALGEYRIRELNDHINRLIREKGHWEKRILELGGANYSAGQSKLLESDGLTVPGGNKEYKYFGEARNLPGVKELFRESAPAVVKKTRQELSKNIDPDYYGFRDDDDYLLQQEETSAEAQAIAKGVEDWKRKREETAKDQQSLLNKRRKADSGKEDEEEDELYVRDEGEDSDDAAEPKFVSHVPLPSEEELKKMLLQKKKEELMKTYASTTLVSSLAEGEQEVKVLLGKK
eukprot:TRINITY_DN3580_c0_g1_i1.p1 TRINITY_DN3580_c0_g1~~TRINITY_DN3580_c0_g1_i1.p1  ORF type:complete len:293 (-),score=86.58 TRINITY_DN3580_c0_g1_i1:213-1091(-)